MGIIFLILVLVISYAFSGDISEADTMRELFYAGWFDEKF